MKFRTEISLQKPSFTISHTDKILILGSCFSTNIGKKLEHHKFKTLINPFGTLYNPISIRKTIEMIIEKKNFEKEDLVFHNNQYSSFFHYSNFSAERDIDCLTKINKVTNDAHEFISECTTVLITYGTAYVYQHLQSNQVVANCHKMSSESFKRFLLQTDQVEKELSKTVELLKSINPNIRILLTVSPIRHLKDGFTNNQLSKSTLLIGIQNLIQNKSVEYFPSYEIMIDDLRDYRFYKEDLVQPNQMAIEYIWQKFQKKYFSNKTLNMCEKICKLRKLSTHKIQNRDSEEFEKFKSKSLQKLENYSSEHPEINFNEEIEYFKTL